MQKMHSQEAYQDGRTFGFSLGSFETKVKGRAHAERGFTLMSCDANERASAFHYKYDFHVARAQCMHMHVSNC